MAVGAVPAVRGLPCCQISRITLPESLTWASTLPKPSCLLCPPAARLVVVSFPSRLVEPCLPPGPKCHSLRSWHRRQGDTFDRNVRFNDRLSQGPGVSSARHIRAPTPATKAAFLSPTLSTLARRGTVVSSHFTFPYSTPTRYRYRCSSLLPCFTTLRLHGRRRSRVCLLRCTAATVTVPLTS